MVAVALSGVSWPQIPPAAPHRFLCRGLACIVHKLVLEVDGATHHSTEEQLAHDKERDAFLRDHGWQVMRHQPGRLSQS
jgi:very-short-patch-repair endonuclease